ncbi:hypothetical protein JCM10914A_41370 [Paenibacillus sp. JCM 10914]
MTIESTKKPFPSSMVGCTSIKEEAVSLRMTNDDIIDTQIFPIQNKRGPRQIKDRLGFPLV